MEGKFVLEAVETSEGRTWEVCTGSVGGFGRQTLLLVGTLNVYTYSALFEHC